MDDSDNGGPSSDDKDLLARLNALKPSPVRFDSQSIAFTPAYHSTDLAARFESLHVRNSATAWPLHVQPDSPSTRDVSSPTLEELIAELECDDQFSLDDADVQEADSVLQEAKRAMRPRDADEGGGKLSDEVADVNEKTDAPSSSAVRLLDGDPETRDREEHEDEDAEAASSLRRILDELDLKEPHTPTRLDVSTPASSQPTSSFFPSTPKSLPTSPIATVPSPSPSAFFLPSPPTAPPSATSTPVGLSKSTSASPYTDTEISSWCAICCADATVRCRGCAGELYCWACWREGHVGEDAGREERGHRWDKVGNLRRGVN